ncbi:MAG: hypothetical protein MZV63_64565 [Marinilabiliales bacterium]|nr:hypothetical protein [Marinilabiliales bacterium]
MIETVQTIDAKAAKVPTAAGSTVVQAWVLVKIADGLIARVRDRVGLARRRERPALKARRDQGVGRRDRQGPGSQDARGSAEKDIVIGRGVRPEDACRSFAGRDGHRQNDGRPEGGEEPSPSG